MAILRCPNNHPVQVPDHPGYTNVNGVRVETASASDLMQDCPLCGQFEHYPDGRSERELHIAGADIVARIVANRRAIMVALANSAEITIDSVAAITGLDVDRITTAVADFRVFDITHPVGAPTVVHTVALTDYGRELGRLAIEEDEA